MLSIKKSDLQVIFDHCLAAAPNEACGMLGGKAGGVEKTYCMRNAKPGTDYYEMDPEEQFRVMKDIRDSGLELIGLFHSHPHSQAYPSSVDVDQAYWPGTQLPNYPDAAYVIVTLMDRAKPVARGFSIEEGKVTEVTMTVIEGPMPVTGEFVKPLKQTQEERDSEIKGSRQSLKHLISIHSFPDLKED